jgi:hypothetical protein
MQQSKHGEEDSGKGKMIAAGQESGDVDGLVSGFMEELAAISPDKMDFRQPESIEKKPVEGTSKPEPTQSRSTERDRSELITDFECIGKEIEESLDELERLKSRIIPIAERKDPIPGSVPSANATEEVPAAETAPPAAPVPINASMPANAPAHASTARIKPAKPPETPDEEEQAWHRLKLRGNEDVSGRPFPWLKTILGSAILVIILGTAAYRLLKLTTFQSSPVAEHASSDPGSARQPTDSQSGMLRNQVRAESITEVPPIYPTSAPGRGITRTVVLEADISESADVVRAAAAPDPLESADKPPLPATSGNTIQVTETADKAR